MDDCERVAGGGFESGYGRKMGLEDHVGDLIRRMIVSIVDTPSSVTVEATGENGRTLYQVSVAGDEVGQVIGRDGRIARAMRTMLAAVARKEKRRIELNIVGGKAQ